MNKETRKHLLELLAMAVELERALASAKTAEARQAAQTKAQELADLALRTVLAEVRETDQ